MWTIRLTRVNPGVRLALAAGLALLATATAVRLARPPLTVLATNSVVAESPIRLSKGDESLCQSDETLPEGASAIRLAVSVNIGPKVTVTVLSGSQVIARGAQAAGWTGEAVTVPIAAVPNTVAGADVCLAIGPTVEPIGLLGQKGRLPGAAGPGKIRVEYLSPGSRSWWSLALPTARRMGLGRSPSGTWVAFIPLVLMAAAVGLAAWLLLRELGRRAAAGPPTPAPIAGAQLAPAPAARGLAHRGTFRGGGRTRHLPSIAGRVPRAAWACGAVAWLSAASWSIVMPPFQVPDEPSHFAYVQQLAETASLPTSSSVRYAPEELAALAGLDHNEVRGNELRSTISSPAQQQLLERELAQSFPRHGEGGAGVAASQPPLYYALQSIPYRLAASGNLLERLALMRLLSALLAGLTAIFAYLFLREALPGVRWAWTVGGLGVALFPLVSFMSGAVNPDSMLCAVSAALFYCLARAFRRGLSTRGAVAIGVVTAVGLLTKLNFIGLVPGLALALTILTRRAVRREGRTAYRSLALTGAIGASPVCVYALINILSNHPGLGLASTGIHQTGEHGSLLGEISYIWQLYLPRLPGMANHFPGLLTSRLWFDRSVGLYGWLDTTFPTWVYTAALLPAGLIAALCVRALIASRAELRRRIWELLAYAAMGLGVMALVGVDSYLQISERSGGYSEPRYLLPMAVLFGAVLALAARGAGRRWGPAVGALIVVLVLGHDTFSQLLVISRYYS
jgi:Predicted membrane protein (DUF2142)